jgi:hypothetical protein
MQERVSQLRKLGFLVADRETARVLVELHNVGAFEAGLVLVETLGYPGAGGLRIDVLTSGIRLGASVTIPELAWHAQAIPYYDYLLTDAEPGAVLAGGYCVPVRIPQAGRFIWHKIYSRLDAPTELKGAFKAAPPTLRTKLAPALKGFGQEFSDALPEVPATLQALRRAP